MDYLNKTQKHYRLIVSHDFSIANETDSDPMSDYSPGIWCIGSQKKALKYAKEYLAGGNIVTVTCYDSPAYYSLANKFIKELGLKQELFPEPLPVIQSFVTISGRPSNLSQLKKYLQVGTKVRVSGGYEHGVPRNTRETYVNSVQGNAVTFEKGGGKSWLYWGKSSEWSFDNGGASQYYIGRHDEEKGKQVLNLRLEYI